ncbi:MAG: TetR/AcrR family transcriptional regulator [Cyanothece sp. SIO1E1]|nr:TetR/AcrR family transcriptional regulator [Cyanothece sp. SIO1E1]
MPRNKEFDPEAALEKAMQLFWRKGYFDTSIEDLVQYVGVNRYGLYGTFGNKHGLFLATLDRYQEMMFANALQGIDSPQASMGDIQDFFEHLVALAKTPQGQLGCLIFNTATEVAPHDPEVADKVRAYLTRLAQAFCRALENAKHREEIPAHIDVGEHADYLVGVIQGFTAYARSPADRQAIEHFARVALSTLKS